MRKLRIHITPDAAHVDYDLPDDWDDLGSYQQYRIIRDLGERAIAEAVSTHGEAVEVATPTEAGRGLLGVQSDAAKVAGGEG